jgi:hypothetical protein
MAPFGHSNRPLPPPGKGGDPTNNQQSSLASLSELNGLLESVLRINGDDAASLLLGGSSIATAPSTATATSTATHPPPSTNSFTADDSESSSSSWRLETMRKLTAVSIKFKIRKDCRSLYTYIPHNISSLIWVAFEPWHKKQTKIYTKNATYEIKMKYADSFLKSKRRK